MLKKSRQPARAQQLESFVDSAATIARFEQSPADWPTYRAQQCADCRHARRDPRVGQPALEMHTRFPVRAHAARRDRWPGIRERLGRNCAGLGCRNRWLTLEDVYGRRSAVSAGCCRGRALVGSGDGYAYAFEAATGRLLWRFRAGPADRTIRVYDRLMSTWPVATGVLVDGQTAYCAAGINNYDGTHVYALDAASGTVKWQNSNAEGIGGVMGAGVAAQGDLLLDGGKLYLAGGSVLSPAAFDLATGEFSAVGQRGSPRPGAAARFHQGPAGRDSAACGGSRPAPVLHARKSRLRSATRLELGYAVSHREERPTHLPIRKGWLEARSPTGFERCGVVETAAAQRTGTLGHRHRCSGPYRRGTSRRAGALLRQSLMTSSRPTY